jgi:hypothetical protein
MALTKVKQRASGASRFVYTATAGQTTFSGADDNSQTLSYDIGFVDVYLNGVKMVNGTDVTVNNGTSVVFASGVALNDIVDINTFGTFDLASFDTSSITSGTLNTARLADSSIANDKLATPGVVLQVVNSIKTDTTASAGAAAWNDSGLSAAIIPSSTSSKILVNVNMSGAHTTSNTWLKIVRDSTDLGLGDAAGSRLQCTFGNFYQFNDGNIMKTHSFQLLDSPSSTSALTYKVQVRSNGGTYYVNRSVTDGDSVDIGRASSTITLMEIKG